jgi:predicted PurR-regulated permease PerM
VTARKVAIWTATVVLVLLGFEFLWLIRNVIFLIFLSILLATGIEPVVRFLRKGPFNKGTGILAVYTLIFGVIALILFLTVPPLLEEGRGLVGRFTNPDNVHAAINSIDNEFLRGVATTAYDNAGALAGGLKVDAGAVTAVFPVFETIFSFFTVFVIAYYWLTERPLIKRFVFSFIPEKRKPRGRLLWDSVEEKLGAWVRGQLVLMLFIGVVAGIGYTIMGLKFAFPLAVFAGFAELIPLVGPYIGGAPAVLIALTQSPTLAVVVVIYIIVIQLVEGNVLVPRIMEKAVGVTPLTVVIGILIGSTLMGIGGALLAVPIAAAAQVIFNNILSFSSEETSDHEAVASSNNTGEALETATVARERERVAKKEVSGDHLGGTPIGS